MHVGQQKTEPERSSLGQGFFCPALPPEAVRGALASAAWLPAPSWQEAQRSGPGSGWLHWVAEELRSLVARGHTCRHATFTTQPISLLCSKRLL